MPWELDDIGSQDGRIVVVTGANSGLGFSTALELARRGANVVLACRDRTRAVAAAGRIRQQHPLASIQIADLDLGDLTSVRTFAREVVENTPHVDLLVNNAGVMTPPLSRTTQGFETQFGVNHLGHFALTGLLYDHLEQAPSPRVVTVSSMMHRAGRIDFENLDARRGYHRSAAYAQSKLANLLFAGELARRAAAAGDKLVSVAAHPGMAGTSLLASGLFSGLPGPARRVLGAVVDSVLPPAIRGAQPVLYAATAPEVRNGQYFGPPRTSMGYWGAPRLEEPATAAAERDVAARLWTVSEDLTGINFLGRRRDDRTAPSAQHAGE